MEGGGESSKIRRPGGGGEGGEGVGLLHVWPPPVLNVAQIRKGWDAPQVMSGAVHAERDPEEAGGEGGGV